MARKAVSSRDPRSQRLRAAWFYYRYGLTQQQTADKLGISRSTAIRLLEQARELQEVRLWIDAGDEQCTRLGVELEIALDLGNAIVVPAAPDPANVDTARAVGLALGRYLSETIRDGMTIGVGWGRTLNHSLDGFHSGPCENARVLSLQGGTVETRSLNPMEFAWRIGSEIGARSFLFPAPLIVDSRRTRRQLIEGCGLDTLYAMAESLDMAVLSVGEVTPDSTSLSRGLIDTTTFQSLIDAGAVADIMCQFVDEGGSTVKHALHERVMSVDLDTIASAGEVIIASAGRHRARALLAAARRLTGCTLITDEETASELLNRVPPMPGR